MPGTDQVRYCANCPTIDRKGPLGVCSSRDFDLLKRIYNDMKGTHERRMSSSGVNPVAELAILNHHFNYTNRPMETEQRTVEQNNLPKLSLSDGQNTNILSNNDNI